MDPWAWIAAYVVGFALLQLLLYRYLSREVRGTEAATPTVGDRAGPQSAAAEPSAGDTIACPSCGADNAREQGYRFCRACTEPLR